MTASLEDFKIEWEWEAAPTVRSPEHRATWARIEMTVDSEHVTLIEDRASQSSRRSIYCPLYPIAEWATYNWWLLQANSRPAIPIELLHEGGKLRHAGRNSASRHCMRSAGDGFSWPNLFIIPEGSATLLRWSADRSFDPNRRTRYLSQGYRFVSTETVTHMLSLLIETVIARLQDQGVTSAPIFDEWDAIQQADDEEVQFCVAAARLGLDAYSDPDVPEEALLRAGRDLGGRLLDDFLDAVDPARIDAGLTWIARAQQQVAESGGQDDPLRQIRSDVQHVDSSPSRQPWQIGYQQARRVRELLSLQPSDVLDPLEYVTMLHVPSDNKSLRAFGGVSSTGTRPAVVIGPRMRETARRFALSRALWHFLVTEDPKFLVTASYTDRQKVERAFAAELLAPARGIAERLTAGVLVEDDLDEIADHFNVAVQVIEHQVQNQELADGLN